MVRNISPLLRQEFANLEKDADSRKSAMRTLKSYAKDIDSEAIPHFLAEVSDNNGGSGECTISLYEVMARVHGRNIVPHIDNIMAAVMRNLSASGGSFTILQACSKVVSAIARYAIDISTLDEEKARIICSLCRPLSDALMSSFESAAPSGAALCLKALVESGNWRFAPDVMVNDVCLKVAGALEEKFTQSNAHMELVMALVKHNGLIVEAFSRSFVHSGLQILNAGVVDGNSQKRLVAVKMINSLMKYVDARSISSELSRIIDAMEKCQSDDKMPFVRGAAFEALQTAKGLSRQKGSRHEVGLSPMSSSNFQRREKSPLRSRNGESGDNGGTGTEFCSPESLTVDSCIKYDNFDNLADSPESVCQSSSNFENVRQTNRRLWNTDGIQVDVSLKDGFFLKASSENDGIFTDTETGSNFQRNVANKGHSESFSGFKQYSGANSGDITPSHRATRPLTIDDVKIYTTPRRLMRSLQNCNDPNSTRMEKQDNGLLPNLLWQEARSEQKMSPNLTCQSQNFNHKPSPRRNIDKTEELKGGVKDMKLSNDVAESVSSTDEISQNNISDMQGLDTGDGNGVIVKKTTKFSCRMGFLLGIFFVILAVMFSLMRDDSEEFLFEAVPT